MRKGAMLLLAVALWLPAGAGAASPPGALAQLGSGFGCQVDEGQAPVAPCVAGVRGIDTPTDLALSPDGFSAYVAGAESDAIAVFDRDPGTGALFQKPGTAGCIVEEPSPNIAGCANVARALDRPTNVAVSPDGTHVYVTATDSNSVVTFDRDVFTGVLTQKSGSEGCIVDTPSPDVPGCNNAGTGLTGAAGIALDGFGTTVYVAGRLSNSVSILDRDTSTGALSQKAGANGCIVDEPSVDIGGCDNTARGMTGPFRLTVSPSDTSVYLIALDNSSLVTFDRDPADGTLQQKAGAAGCSVASADADCQIVRAMTAPQSLATAGASVYVAASGSDAIAVFDRAGDGTLTQDSGPPGCVVDEPAGDISNCDNSGRGLDEPFAVATSLDGRNVYAAGGDDAIAVFDRNSTNGDLTQKSGTAGCLGDDTGCAPAAGTGDIVDFALPFNGRSVLGVGVQSDALLAFRRDVVPTCTPLSPTVQHNEPAALALTCTDLNNDPITISIETPPANGSVTLNGNRAVYTPNAGHVGADSFTYKATANGAESDPATVTADVLPGGAPVCAPRSQPVRPRVRPHRSRSPARPAGTRSRWRSPRRRRTAHSGRSTSRPASCRTRPTVRSRARTRSPTPPRARSAPRPRRSSPSTSSRRRQTASRSRCSSARCGRGRGPACVCATSRRSPRTWSWSCDAARAAWRGGPGGHGWARTRSGSAPDGRACTA
jgi:DNA-binding beta-propeller fold protein YncE